MRVGINARLLAGPDLRGFNRYTAELVRALAAAGDVEPVLFSDAPLHPVHRLGSLTAIVAPVRPQARWQHVWLRGAIRRARVDLFHAPAHWGIPWRPPCPTIVTIHDLADRELRTAPLPPPSAPFAAAARHRFEEWLVVRRAARIVTVSEWSARSIQRHLGVAAGRTAVTVEGAAPAFGPAAASQAASVRTEAGLPERYFLCVGGFEPRKNLGAVVRALALTSPAQRTAVGLVGRDEAGAAALLAEARAAGVAEWLRPLGARDDEGLAALYAGAVAVVVPSWLEGFGLPVVEAMHCGTPAIVADAAALPEIAGDAALTFPPADAAALAERMRALAGDADLRASLAARARTRAPRYTWARAAEQTRAVYEAALADR